MSSPNFSDMDVQSDLSSKNDRAYWVVSDRMKQKCDAMFSLHDVDEKGFVLGQNVRRTFVKSGISMQALARIWDLCDIDQKGKLSGEEFALAMWLIHKAKAGQEPPEKLTPCMIPPSIRSNETFEFDIDEIRKFFLLYAICMILTFNI